MSFGGHSTRSVSAAAAEGYWRNALYSVFAVTLARVLWLALGQTDLYPDEAQYWYWSLHPAFGYYSKPPLVAWLIALTTHFFGDDALAVRIGAPLLHFATALTVFALARRLYDARVAAWSAVVYATLPGVTASAMIVSTDAPLLLCWAVALYAFVVAREGRGWQPWIVLGVAAGLGLLSKYAMAYWLISAAIFLGMFRDERRHLPRFLAATALALAIYSPNFFWNWTHGFASYHHTEDNAALGGPLFHPGSFLAFFGAQFGVFGPILFAGLVAIVARAGRDLAERRAALLACFALPSLAMMFVVSFLSRAQPNWAAPAYVSASVLVVAWFLARGWRWAPTASVVLHIVAAVLLLEARDIAQRFGYDLPARYDVLHRLRGWSRLGAAISFQLEVNPGVHLLAGDRETMAALLYYVHPHPLDALKWNGDDNKVHDGFDLEAHPDSRIGQDFLLVSANPDANYLERIYGRFAKLGPVQHLIIPLGAGQARHYTVRLLDGFKGYASQQ